MATLDFSRSVETDLQIKEDRLLNAVLDFTRDDAVAVDFTSKSLKMDIYKKDEGTAIDTLTSGVEITISTARLTWSFTPTDLLVRTYYYELYNDTDKIGIMHGKLIVT